MNFLTGSSACIRKAIYEFLVIEESIGNKYDERIKSLYKKYPNIDKEYFDIIGKLTDLTSIKMHEGSWEDWNNVEIRLFIDTLKTLWYEIYVYPEEKKERFKKINVLKSEVSKKKLKQME